ncbi:MAG: phosphatase PAP2 family protein [Gemmatimonadaceae bacterium]|nr:phosphatase PAP2 family protein [Gemmatimonadaceae bacterium]
MSTTATLHHASSVRDPRADRAIGLASTIILAFLIATVAPLFALARADGPVLPLAAHLFVLAIVSVARISRGQSVRVVRDWVAPLCGPFLYLEMRWVVAGTGRPHMDALVAVWEEQLFPSDPSRTLASRYPVPWLSELLHAGYLAYYALVALPPLLLYLRGRRSAYAETVLALTLTYVACFVAFALFPVDGPRFLHGPAAAPAGMARSLVLALLEHGSSRGTAFPSSHVAATVVATLLALRLQPCTGRVMVPLSAALILGTVYGGFHYGVDALAGLVLGALMTLASTMVWRSIPDGEHTATAA